MRFVWNAPPDAQKPKLDSRDALLGSADGRRLDFQQHKEDLKEYFDRITKQDPAEAKAFKANLDQWDTKGDTKTMRLAGDVDGETDLKDCLRRHVFLSNAFLKLKGSTGAGKYIFSVDFVKNELAYNRVGAADMLPPNINAIAIRKENGTEVCKRAIRLINPNTGRIGYYDEEKYDGGKGTYEYIPVYSGDEIEVLETEGQITADGSLGARGNRRALQEHIENYQKEKSAASALEKTEERYDPATRTLKDASEVGKRPLTLLEALKKATEEREAQLKKMREQLKNGITAENLTGRPGILMQEAKNSVERCIAQRKNNEQNNEFTAEFNDLKNGLEQGKLGCSWVVTTYLMRAGYLDHKVAGVDELLRILTDKEHPENPSDPKKWKEVFQPLPGAIVVWEKDPVHGHVGLVYDSLYAFDNNSNAKPRGPDKRLIARKKQDGKTDRKARFFIPPDYPSFTDHRSAQTPQESRIDGAAAGYRADVSRAPTTREKGKNLPYAQARDLIDKENPGFRAGVEHICSQIGGGCTAEDLYRIMYMESYLDPTKINRSSGASGLIQFMPKTAIKQMHTTVEAIRNMSAMEQLDLVEDYFRSYFGKNLIHGPVDLYRAIFYPASLGQGGDFVFGSENHDPFKERDVTIMLGKEKKTIHVTTYKQLVGVQNWGINGGQEITNAAFERWATRHIMR